MKSIWKFTISKTSSNSKMLLAGFLGLAGIGMGLIAAPVHGALQSNPSSELAEPRPQVVLAEVQNSKEGRKLLYPARVESKMTSSMTADLDGYVVRIAKTLGSRVRAGETVLVLKNSDPALTFSEVAVKSPIRGVLTQVNIPLMSKVLRGDRLFTVTNSEEIRVVAEIPSADLQLLKSGMRGIYRERTGSTAEILVEVRGISPVIDARTGTATAELDFTQRKNLPALGSVGQITFEISTGSVVLIPENSIGYLDGKPSVKVVDESRRVRRVPIEIGEQREDHVILKSGLSVGSRIVVRSSRSLKDNEEVEIQVLDSEKNSEKNSDKTKLTSPEKSAETSTAKRTVKSTSNSTEKNAAEKNVAGKSAATKSGS